MSLAGYFFDRTYRETSQLRDGSRVLLRLVRPSDKALLERGFSRLSPESRYFRFFAAKERLSEQELSYLTELDHVHHLAIGAQHESAAHAEGAGIARFIRLRDEPDVAEAAIAVADEMQGKGLGTLLLTRLIAAAGERGIKRFRFEVLAENTGMLRLLEAIAPERRQDVAAGVVAVDFALPEATPQGPPDQAPRDSAIYRVLRGAAENARPQASQTKA